MNEPGFNTVSVPGSTASQVTITLEPLGRALTVNRNTPLQDLLFAQGAEFPCGGQGRCKGCRVRLLDGYLPVTSEDARLLSDRELREGWRLACQAAASSNVSLELAQWESAILTDDSAFEFTPREGLGVVIDLGTTTLAGQLLDLHTGQVLAVRTALNAQARHGSDIMSRIDCAVHQGGQSMLQELIRQQIGGLVSELLAAGKVDAGRLKEVVLAGNTVMHHLFCGISLEPLSGYPFELKQNGPQVFSSDVLGWKMAGHPIVRFLPCLGSFVGSDILAGVLATKMHESEALVALVDLGTNGEIVVGNRQGMLCASTAAGPAFEGARISMGVRAATGAISEVSVSEGRLRCRTLGDVPPRGLCGSGLVDAVAGGLDLGWINSNGRLACGTVLELAPPVVLTQRDIRELQLAKGAIAAGLRLLIEEWGARPDDLARIHLAGAFGNYINRASARRIGLLGFPFERIIPSGNTALLGAKLALFSLAEQDGSYAWLRQAIRHVSLNEQMRFQDLFVEELPFPV
jgi:uncharacterized 2Fe-2S/4Fe-4S cluster protein (DUF4445 family)